jgi:hypothetical protein
LQVSETCRIFRGVSLEEFIAPLNYYSAQATSRAFEVIGILYADFIRASCCSASLLVAMQVRQGKMRTSVQRLALLTKQMGLAKVSNMKYLSKIAAARVAVLLAMGAAIGLISGMTNELGFTEGSGGSGGMTPGNVLNIFLGINPENHSIYGLLPGFLFGSCLSILYWRNLKRKNASSITKIICILVLCAACFFIARGSIGAMALSRFPEFDVTKHHGAIVGLPGFISTLVMLLGLTHAYSWKWVISVSLLGGIAAIVFMAPASTAPLLGQMDSIIFFVGWQSVMLVAACLPLTQPNLKSMA